VRPHELGPKIFRGVADHNAQPQADAALERLRLHLANADSTVEMRLPKFLRELKQREQCVCLLVSLEFGELFEERGGDQQRLFQVFRGLGFLS